MITPQDYIISFVNQDIFTTNTKYFYKRHIDQFCSYLAKLKTIHLFPHKITQKMIRGYIVYMEDIGYKNISINAKFSAIKSFYRWARKNHRVDDPTYGLLLKKRLKNPPKAIREYDLKKLLNYMKQIRWEENKLRDSCVIRLFYETGAKINEIHQLECFNINTISNTIVIGKRIMRISTILGNDLKKYIDSFKRKHLFMNRQKKHITTRSISRIVVKRSKECGLSNINCTSFRDAFAYRFKQKEGVTKGHMAVALGLNSVECTNQNYKNFVMED